jgi:PIN domain nuclease of toxin-antitoxin system
MNDILADTHAIVWTLFEPSKLSAAALRQLQNAQAAGGRVLVSAITLVEVTYLVEKRKLVPAVLSGLWAAIADPGKPVDAVPVSLDVARFLDQIPRGIVPDMPDRIIAATALSGGFPLVSADRKIRSLNVLGLSVIW